MGQQISRVRAAGAWEEQAHTRRQSTPDEQPELTGHAWELYAVCDTVATNAAVASMDVGAAAT
jgi:hypothetical protein